MSGDVARAMVVVAAPIERAFELFTQDVDRWWRRGQQFRHLSGETGHLVIEPFVGGRFIERSAAREIEIGRVTVWEPPTSLAFSWRNANFAPGEVTHVTVSFQADGSDTRVSVEHRGWASLRADHPARHGLEPAAFIGANGRWWGQLLTTYRLLGEASV